MLGYRNDEIFLELWSKEFGVLPQTFEFIVNLVVGSMGKRNTNFRNAIINSETCK